MGKPKSFKEMFADKIKAPFRQEQNIIQPNNINSDGRYPIPSYQPRFEAQKKELKEFVEKERCLVCGAQLDGPVEAKEARLYCVENNSHFNCKYLRGQTDLVWAKAIYSYTSWEYEVTCRLMAENQGYNISIYKLDSSLNERYKQLEKKLIYNFIGIKLIFDKGLTEEEFLAKLNFYCALS